MSQAPLQLGDTHNFGRRVTLAEGRVLKPRALLWEWCLLSAESPIRRALGDAAAHAGFGEQAFSFLPTLQFFPDESGVGGAVSAVRLEPLGELSAAEKRELSRIVGRSLALFSWLGVADLHWENLVLGVDDGGRTVFGPLDIELILADLARPTETKLLPDADPEYAAICRHASGVRRVLPYLGKPIPVSELVAIAAAYLDTLSLLDRHAEQLTQAFLSLPALRETPIRVCLRGTEEYVKARSKRLWPPLLEAEKEQLARGDIPYFFRLYGRRGIHYYADETLSELSRLPLEGDVPQLDPMLELARGLRVPSRKRLLREGLFTVLGAFDHASFSGEHQAEGLRVAFQKRTLVVGLPNGEELESARDLSSFVGSVYLPCTCGEVRAVFVPQVTRCAALTHPAPRRR